MRRRDRELKELDDIIRVMEKCDVCRLALNDAEYPYILPLNFGMQVDEHGQITLYFHGTREGKKYELMARDNRAGFEMDCSHELFIEEEKGNCTMAYESVIGYGRIRQVPDDEKSHALYLLMKHYHKEDFSFNQAIIPQTVVLKLIVEHVSGKRRMRK